MKLLYVALALPVAGFAYLKATKQTIKLNNGLPKIVKINAVKVENIGKEAVKTAASVVTQSASSRAQLARTILEAGKRTVEGAK